MTGCELNPRLWLGGRRAVAVAVSAFLYNRKTAENRSQPVLVVLAQAGCSVKESSGYVTYVVYNLNSLVLIMESLSRVIGGHER